jgi:hypothetical protein
MGAIRGGKKGFIMAKKDEEHYLNVAINDAEKRFRKVRRALTVKWTRRLGVRLTKEAIVEGLKEATRNM